jgi:transposase
VLVRVDRVLDLSWLRDEVADLYCFDDGRPGIDPEVAVRLMLAGLLTGIVHDRKLMREAHVNIAIRWFVGYGLHEKIPDHSLTRIRQRWGAERFRKILKRTVEKCLQAKIATGEIVHIDASLIRANVSWDSLVERHDSRSQRIQASREGGQITTRAHSSSCESACPSHALPTPSSWCRQAALIRSPDNNPLERILREIRRRTRVVGAFPDGQSALNLAAARLRHIAGTAWSTKRYLNIELLKDQQMRGAIPT